MTPATPARPIPSAPGPQHPGARWGLFSDLRDPRQILGNIGPNWFASIMGTGIVANAAATLPLAVSGLRTAATVVWVRPRSCSSA